MYISNADTGGTITNRYDLYASSANANNYFAGNVGIGTATPAYALDVHGTGNFTGPITFASNQTFPGMATLGANNFTGLQFINGSLNVSSTSGEGVYGTSSASNGTGVTGNANGYGVYGYSPSGYGMYGFSGGTGVGGQGSPGVCGVNGSVSCSLGTWGVYGASSSGTGVYGNSTSSYGVEGASNSSDGVWGTSASGNGVYGSSGTGIGVEGYTTGSSEAAVCGLNGNGLSCVASSGGIGVEGVSFGTGVYASGSDTGLNAIGDNYGVYAMSSNNTGAYAGYFWGNIKVTGSITAGTKDFEIDHPPTSTWYMLRSSRRR